MNGTNTIDANKILPHWKNYTSDVMKISFHIFAKT